MKRTVVFLLCLFFSEVSHVSAACCKYCTPGKSKPCGDSCISLDKTCHQPLGCACSGTSSIPPSDSSSEERFDKEQLGRYVVNGPLPQEPGFPNYKAEAEYLRATFTMIFWREQVAGGIYLPLLRIIPTGTKLPFICGSIFPVTQNNVFNTVFLKVKTTGRFCDLLSSPTTFVFDQRKQDNQKHFNDTQAFSINGILNIPSLVNTLKQGTFGHFLVSGSNKCLDTPDPNALSGKVQIWDCLDNTNQQWRLEGDHIMTSGNKCLDAPLPSIENGIVHLWDCLDHPNQQWRLKDKHIINSGGKCLSTPDGDALGGIISLQPCYTQNSENKLSQEWEFSITDTHQILSSGDKCLDAPAPSEVGGKVYLWDCHEGPNQQWWLTNNLLMSSGDKCLDAPVPNAIGGIVHLWDCFGGPNQQWRREGNQIISSGGKCLDAPEPKATEGIVQLWDCYGNLNQQWKIFPDNKNSKNSTSTIKFKSSSNKCLDAPDPSAVGGTVHLWDCYDSPNQQWRLEGDHIVSSGGKCLDAPEPNAMGGIIHLWDCYEGPNQQWRLEDDNIVSSGEKCLDAPEPNAVGGIIHLWDCYEGPNQQWLSK